MPTLAIFKCDSCGEDISMVVDAVTDEVHTCAVCLEKAAAAKKAEEIAARQAEEAAAKAAKEKK